MRSWSSVPISTVVGTKFSEMRAPSTETVACAMKSGSVRMAATVAATTAPLQEQEAVTHHPQGGHQGAAGIRDPSPLPQPVHPDPGAEAKARAEEERKILKEANNAPKVIEKIEAAIAVLEGNIEEIDARLMDAGSDVSKAQEIQIERDAKASKMQLYYDEWERLEGVLARAEEIRAAQEVPA